MPQVALFYLGVLFLLPKLAGGKEEAGGRALILKNAFGWPILAGLFFARVGSFSCPFSNFYFLVSIPGNAHFSSNLPANPANPSCQACVIMPGRKLFRVSAKIPNSKPYTAMRIADLPP